VFRYGIGAFQVDLDLYTSGLTPIRCVTTQAAVATQVFTVIHVGYYDLPKVGATPQQH
jgi:hypothetical protein